MQIFINDMELNIHTLHKLVNFNIYLFFHSYVSKLLLKLLLVLIAIISKKLVHFYYAYEKLITFKKLCQTRLVRALSVTFPFFIIVVEFLPLIYCYCNYIWKRRNFWKIFFFFNNVYISDHNYTWNNSIIVNRDDIRNY